MMRCRWETSIFILTAIILAALLILLTPDWKICSWDFRNCLWGPVHMLVHGQPPYSTDTPYGSYPASWLPMAMGAFFYLGWLPCTIASKIWFLTEIGALGLIIWLLAGRALPAPRLFLFSLLAAAFFPPLYLHFRNGQFTLLFIVLVMTSVFVPGARRWRPLLLAIGLTKPQLGLLIYPGILIAEFHQYGMKGALRLVLATAACAALLTIPLFIVHPDWPGDFLGFFLMYAGPSYNTPTLYAQLPALIGPAGRVIWALTFVLGLALSVLLWWRVDARRALVWSMVMTPIVIPYTWSYDLVLVLPALYWLMFTFRGKIARAVLLSGALLVDIAITAARWETDLGDGFHWWVPSAMLLVFVIALLVEQKTRQPAAYMEDSAGHTT